MAFTTPKLALRVWNLLSDPYDHDQLANNWAKVDLHDHTFGRGVQVPTDGLADGSVTSAKLAPGAAALQANSITADKFANLPATRVYNSVVLPLTTAVNTLLTFDTERYDTDNIHDLVTNTGRLTCKTAGVYRVALHLDFVSNATGYRQVQLRLNGTTVFAQDTRVAVNGANTSIALSTVFRLAINDYVEGLALQNSGVALNVSATSAYSPELSATWLAP